MKGSSKQGSNEAYQGKHVVQSQASASNGYTPIQQGEVVVDGTVLQKQRDKKPFIIAAASVIAALLVVYGAGFLYFSSHFFPNTNLNDEDLSMQSSDVLAEKIQHQADSYALTISGQGFSYSFQPGETAIDIDAHQIAEDAAKRQDVPLWFIEVFRQHDVSDIVVANYEEGALDSIIDEQISAFNEGMNPSADATVTYNEPMDSFVLKPEVYGTQLDADAVCAKAGECIKAMRTNCELTEDDLIKPKVLSSDSRVMDAVQRANDLFPDSFSLMLNGSVKAATIDKATFAGWLSISPEDYSLSISQDGVASWVNEKAEGTNTVGATRTWTREDGKVCTVSGGTYGWKVDTNSLSQDVYDALVAGGATSVDIPCSQSGDTYNGAGARDWGAYVDVDISEQTARYYDASGNLLHSCGVVTGKPVNGRSTPTGVYYLNNKQSPCTLIGYKPNGEKDYETKVTYWMPFIGNSIGLHDATWQSSFGGTRYQTNGSHGCVNLSSGDAQWFYQNLNKGVCIITHN